MSDSAHFVIVGVNGSAQDESAMRVGIAEARRLGVGVRLVHVVPDYVAISPVVPLTHTDLAGLGAEIMTIAEKTLREVDPDIELETQLLHGPRAKRLAEAAVGAPTLVVGRDDRSMLDRMLRGNTATGVAATAGCPVLSVPGGWRPTPPRGTVVVGVKSAAHAPELLGDAFALAASSGAKLVVLHAWKVPDGYDDILESRGTVEEWGHRGTTELDALLAGCRRTWPDVWVETRIVHARPAVALLEASHEADELVVVRRAHGVPAAAHLGRTARALLRSADCPVRVVPAVTD